MSVGTRHFLVDDDEIRPLTQSIADRLRRGEALLPGYAGRDLHVVDVTVELDRRRPVKVRGISTAILSLDAHGALRSRLLEDLRAALAQSRIGRVPRQAQWTPSQAQLERITDLALGRAKPKLRPPRTSAADAPPRRGSSAPRAGPRVRVATRNRGE